MSERVDLVIRPRSARCGACGERADAAARAHDCGAVFTHIIPGPISQIGFDTLYALRPDLVAANAPAPREIVYIQSPAAPRPPNVIEQSDEDRRLGGLVYFIQHATGGAIKIGISTEPYYRLKNINANTHDPRYAFLATEHGGRPREVELHLRFAHLRMHGEWFQPEQDLLDYIEEVKDA